MRGVNKIILVGNATRDAELRHTQTGKPVSSLAMTWGAYVGSIGGRRSEVESAIRTAA